jgi:hypothetical protein
MGALFSAAVSAISSAAMASIGRPKTPGLLYVTPWE